MDPLAAEVEAFGNPLAEESSPFAAAASSAAIISADAELADDSVASAETPVNNQEHATDAADTPVAVSATDSAQQQYNTVRTVSAPRYTINLTGVERWASSTVFIVVVYDNETNRERTIRREYEDLAWLRAELTRLSDTKLVPSLPPPPAAESTSVVLDRLRAPVATFLARIAEHPALTVAEPSQTFFGPETEMPWKKGGVRKPEPSLRAPAAEAKEVDAKFDEVRKQYLAYENALKAVTKGIDGLTRSRLSFGQYSLSAAEMMNLLGTIEIDPLFSSALRKWGKTWGINKDLIRVHAENESEILNGFLKHITREITSVKGLLDTRLQYLATSQRGTKNARAKKEIAEKMRADPRHRIDKMAKAEQELEEAEKNEIEYLKQYEQANVDVTAELQRYEMNKYRDVKQLLLSLADAQIASEKQIHASYASLQPDIDAIKS